MSLTEIIGGLAALITTLCWLPQAFHIIRTQETSGVSLVSYTAFAIGLLFWLAYGVMLGSLPIILANSVTVFLVLAIIVIKIRIDGIGIKT